MGSDIVQPIFGKDVMAIQDLCMYNAYTVYTMGIRYVYWQYSHWMSYENEI